MEEGLKISVIVPIYKSEEYLDKCVNSLLTQTYKNLEIILVDDGSPDGCGKKCDFYAKFDKRVLVIHQKNGGAAVARNTGLNLASGEYVYFMDSDDWLELNTFEIIAQEIMSTQVDILRFNYVREYENHSQPKKNVLLKSIVYKGEEYLELFRQSIGLINTELQYIENFNFFGSACLSCYKRSIIEENNLRFIGLQELGSFEDGLFNIQFLSKASSFLYIDQYLYHYRKDNVSSYTYTSKDDLLKKNLVLFKKIENVVQQYSCGMEFEQAYFNRIAYCVLELNLNAIKNRKAGFRKRYKEIETILQSEPCKTACKRFSLQYLPLKWKVYYFFVKMRWTLGVYFLTKAILYLKGRK